VIKCKQMVMWDDETQLRVLAHIQNWLAHELPNGRLHTIDFIQTDDGSEYCFVYYEDAV
jgi:hypothetical protein